MSAASFHHMLTCDEMEFKEKYINNTMEIKKNIIYYNINSNFNKNNLNYNNLNYSKSESYSSMSKGPKFGF